jgi:signal transduction histidine kinase
MRITSMMTTERSAWNAEALDAVIRLTQAINAGQDMDQVFHAVATELARFVAYDRCAFAAFDQSAQMLRVIHVKSVLPAYPLDGISQPLAGSAGGWVIEHRQPLIYTLGAADRFPEDPERRAAGIVCVVLLPVTVDNVIVGTLALSSTHEGAYHAAHLWLLEAIANQFGLAVAATRLRRDAEVRARHAQFLAEAGGILAEATDVSRVLDRVLAGAAAMFGDVNAVILRDLEGDDWVLQALAARTPTDAATVRSRLSSPSMVGRDGLLAPVFRGTSVLRHHQPDAAPVDGGPLAAIWDDARSLLATPIVTRGEVLGAFVSAQTASGSSGNERGSGQFTDLDLQAAREFARRLADALARSRLHAETRRALDMSEALRRIGQELLTSVDQNQVVDLVATFARLLLDADYAAVAAQEPSGTFTWQTVVGNHTDWHDDAHIPYGVGPAGRVAATRQAIVIDDLAKEESFAADELELYAAEELRSAVVVPLRAEERVFGALLVGCRQVHRFPPAELHLVELLAAQAAIALEHARLFAETRQALAERDRFLSVAAHELRTPLTTLRGRLQLLQRRLGGTTTAPATATATATATTTAIPQTEESLRVVLAQIDRLTHMVSDLLDVSRLRTGGLPLNRTPVDLVDLTRQSVEEANEGDQGLPLSFSSSVETLIAFVDPWRFEQVMSNLITNARRFTADDGHIDVRLKQEGDMAIIEVADTGIGIPAADLDRIFEPFYQVNPNAGRGVGLGLAICRQIVTGHGGRLWAAPAAGGHGSVFTVMLPIDEGD